MNEESNKTGSETAKDEWQKLAEQLPDKDLHLGAQYVMSRFIRLEKYVDIIEAQMEEFQRIEQMCLGGTGDDEEDETQWRNHFYEFDDHYVPTLRYSLVIMVQMLIERGLVECCAWLKHEHGSNFCAVDLKGSNVDQCSKFIERLTDIRIKTICEWSKIDSLQEVRNCIVHELGGIENLSERKKEKIAQICKNEPGLSVDENEKLKVDFAYAKNQIEHAKAFFGELFKRLDFRCRSRT